jgi:hypothetical protein
VHPFSPFTIPFARGTESIRRDHLIDAETADAEREKEAHRNLTRCHTFPSSPTRNETTAACRALPSSVRSQSSPGSALGTDPLSSAGVIGGSGLYKLDNLKVERTVNPVTPWGVPSSPITIASLETPTGKVTLAFLARHGLNHSIPPSKVPARANIAALKHLGVKAIVAFSAVGSLKEEVRPGDIVIPDQVIDRTKVGHRSLVAFQVGTFKTDTTDCRASANRPTLTRPWSDTPCSASRSTSNSAR